MQLQSLCTRVKVKLNDLASIACLVDRKQELTLTKKCLLFQIKIPIILSSKQLNWTCRNNSNQRLTRWLQCRAAASRVPSVNQWALSLQTRAVNNRLIQGQQIAVPRSLLFCSLLFSCTYQRRKQLIGCGLNGHPSLLSNAASCLLWLQSVGRLVRMYVHLDCYCVFAIWSHKSHPVQITVRLNLKKLHWCMNDA